MSKVKASRVCEVLARGRSFELLGITGHAFPGKAPSPSQRAFILRPQPYVSYTLFHNFKFLSSQPRASLALPPS